MNDDATRTLVIKNFPLALHRALRIESAETGETLSQIVAPAVREALAARSLRPERRARREVRP